MATSTINCFFDAGVSLADYKDTNGWAYYRPQKNDTIGLYQFDIPQMVDVSISSAKLRVFVSKTYAWNITLNAQLYDNVNNYRFSGDSGETPENLSSIIEHPIVTSTGEYKITQTSQDFNRWVEIDITNLVTGNLGKKNFSIGVLCSEKSQSGAPRIETIEGGYTAQIVITYTDAVPFPPTLTYPLGDILENSGTIRFQWKSSSTQTKYEFGWKMQSSTDWNNSTIESKNQYHDMDASLFANGVVEWRVRIYNSKNMVSEFSVAQLYIVGKPPRPTIANVKNDAITIITWEANKAEEVAAQLQIKKGDAVIYDSGKIPGGVDDSYTPDLILPDGQYVALMRISNIYDMWSDWISKTFTIGGTRPETPVLRAYDQGNHVTLEYSGNAAEYFVYRSENGEDYVPIARVTEKSYDDYAISSGVNYKYFIRAYIQSYADSNKASVYMSFRGFFLSPVNGMQKSVRLFLSDEENPETSINVSREKKLVQYAGRNYPVEEKGELVSRTVSLSRYLNKNDARVVEKMIESGEVLCLRGDRCKIFGVPDSMSMKQNVIFGGFFISFSLEEVDYKERVRFNV